MKRLVFFLFIAVFLTCTVFSQNRNDRQDRNDRQRSNETVTIDGTLQLEKGFVAVANGDSVYIVPMLNRYIGFIDGLKEGAKASVEGYEFKNSIRPVKITINGKSYDFTAGAGQGIGNDELQRGDFGPGRGGMQSPNNRRLGFGRGGPSCCW
jgi:hypothetical protein